MPVVAVAVQAVLVKTPVITDMNILHQTAALALHQTCWETYIILPAVEAVAHTICLQAVAQAE
jgi:hypothetical protein